MTVQEREAQRQRALQEANEVRSWRARMKEDIAAAQLNADEVILSEHPLVQTMQVDHVLRPVPGLGPTKRRQMLGRGLIAPSARVQDLTSRQRAFLLVELRRHRESSKVHHAKAAARAAA